MATPKESVQCFGRKKTAVAVTHCKRGRGLIKINGCPIELVEPEILRFKAYEPILLLGRQRFAGVDMRIRVKGGGHTSQIYAIRQSIAKALVAFYQKYVDEQSKKEIKDILVRYDRTLLVADPRSFAVDFDMSYESQSFMELQFLVFNLVLLVINCLHALVLICFLDCA
ncbi:hypothetical protein OIU84_018802 [Salix udensis]|uniref:40S ribosomal protein S16 n=1 Tax=Salix udensis TaxID=889485 RepID=A0AAD6KXL3_9ROSI|nr:hypothetical protein OIU84_018802 [Salix udensis]